MDTRVRPHGLLFKGYIWFILLTCQPSFGTPLLWWTLPRAVLQSSTLFFRFKTHACGRWQYQSLNIRQNTMSESRAFFFNGRGGGGSRGWINLPRGLRCSFDTLFCEFNKLEYSRGGGGEKWAKCKPGHMSLLPKIINAPMNIE